VNAALALHVQLSLRLDAIEAYRLAHAYRDEELQKFADRLASRATLYGDSRTVGEVIRDLRQLAGEKATAPAAATPELTVYRATWDVAPLDTYTTEAEARKHCEDHARRDLPTASFDWIVDEEDGVAELVAAASGEENFTGYVVTALEIASKYDPEADE